MASVVGGLHVLGFLLLFGVLVPHGHAAGAGAVTAGAGLTAYTLGLRHAFDADHVSAIDTTTRKLMAEGKRPLSLGLFFSLGHSTVVLVVASLLGLGLRGLGGAMTHGGSTLHGVTSWLGTGVSGAFLYLIAGLNLVVLAGIVRVWRNLRSGAFDEQQLERELASRGAMNRVFGRLAGTVRRPWHMYPIGALFGLGFDTATEVALLVLAAGAVEAGTPVYASLCLPILFAAGMSLLDTLDGSFMTLAYDWALARPVRKVFYNLTVTALSVAVALVVGTIELVGLAANEAGARGPFWSWWESLDMSTLGLIIVGLFVLTWVLSLAVWHFGRIEERWTSPGLSEAAGPR
jgi:high-affinity nickel-transport protein